MPIGDAKRPPLPCMHPVRLAIKGTYRGAHRGGAPSAGADRDQVMRCLHYA